jgi:hypothetical protein
VSADPLPRVADVPPRVAGGLLSRVTIRRHPASGSPDPLESARDPQ